MKWLSRPWVRDPWLSLAALLWSFAIALVVSSIAHAVPDTTPPTGPHLIPPGAALDPLHPTLEFANASQLGMTSACACTAVTGTRGEALTFGRASSGTCLKGNWQSIIAAGDMVTCSAAQPRVMPGGTGTGGNGLLVEGSRTSTTLRSQEIDNVVWSTEQSGVAAPIVTADQAIAPNNTLTAERLQVPATAGGQYSNIYQTSSCNGTGVAVSGSIFVKGVSGSGTLDVTVQGSSNPCVACAFNSTTWTRCKLENISNTAVSLIFGSSAVYGGACAGAAADVYVWGTQCEIGAFASSYIATTSAAVTRATEVATLPLVLTNATGSFFVTAVAPATFGDGDHGVAALSVAGPTYSHPLVARAATSQFTIYSAAGGGVTINNAFVANTVSRVGGYWTNAANVTAVFDGVSGGVGAWSAVVPSTIIEIGSYSGTAQFFGVVKNVCVDADSTRCR